MKKIHIAIPSDPGAQWWDWIRALSDSGFQVDIMKPWNFEEHVRTAQPGDMILLDGLLANLSARIYSACAHAPETNVVVLTEIDSFSIEYEVLSAGGAIYISGPIAGDQFVETILRVAMNQTSFTAAS